MSENFEDFCEKMIKENEEFSNTIINSNVLKCNKCGYTGNVEFAIFGRAACLKCLEKVVFNHCGEMELFDGD